MLERGRLGTLAHPRHEIRCALEHAPLDITRPILVSHRPSTGLHAYGVEQSFEEQAVEAIRSLSRHELFDDVRAVVRKPAVRKPLGRGPASCASVLDRSSRLLELFCREVPGVPLEDGTRSRTIREFVRALLVAASKLAHEGPSHRMLGIDLGKQAQHVRSGCAIHLLSQANWDVSISVVRTKGIRGATRGTEHPVRRSPTPAWLFSESSTFGENLTTVAVKVETRSFVTSRVAYLTDSRAPLAIS